jgi:hypothetical protein
MDDLKKRQRYTTGEDQALFLNCRPQACVQGFCSKRKEEKWTLSLYLRFAVWQWS